MAFSLSNSKGCLRVRFFQESEVLGMADVMETAKDLLKIAVGCFATGYSTNMTFN